MGIGTKEHAELMAMFEKEFKHRRLANRCAKDFAPLRGQTAATAPKVIVTEVQGRMTFEGWRTVQGGAA